MRVSGPAHGDGGSVGSVVQLPRPVVPVVSSLRSRDTITGEITCSCAGEKVLASNGGAAGTGSFCSCARVTGWVGAPPASGVGKNGPYSVLGELSSDALTKNVTGSIVSSLNWRASALFGPGVPSALTMPFENRLATCC